MTLFGPRKKSLHHTFPKPRLITCRSVCLSNLAVSPACLPAGRPAGLSACLAVLSCPALPCPALSCPVLSLFVPSCGYSALHCSILITCCPILSCPSPHPTHCHLLPRSVGSNTLLSRTTLSCFLRSICDSIIFLLLQLLLALQSILPQLM